MNAVLHISTQFTRARLHDGCFAPDPYHRISDMHNSSSSSRSPIVCVEEFMNFYRIHYKSGLLMNPLDVAKEAW